MYDQTPSNLAPARDALAGLSVDRRLRAFIEQEALSGSGIAPDAFWQGLAGLVRTFAPRDRDLLAVRDRVQGQIDEYHRARRGQAFDQAGYEQFLRDLGYVLPEPEDFAVRTQNVDDEIARIAGPSWWCRWAMPATR